MITSKRLCFAVHKLCLWNGTSRLMLPTCWRVLQNRYWSSPPKNMPMKLTLNCNPANNTKICSLLPWRQLDERYWMTDLNPILSETTRRRPLCLARAWGKKMAGRKNGSRFSDRSSFSCCSSMIQKAWWSNPTHASLCSFPFSFSCSTGATGSRHNNWRHSSHVG